MTAKEFKDWFEGFCDGSEAEKQGFTPEQVKKMLEVAKNCKETENVIYSNPRLVEYPGTIPTFPNTTFPYTNTTSPYTTTSTQIDLPQPLSIQDSPGINISATSTNGSSVPKEFIPENKSGSKVDAMKLIQGLKMLSKKEE